METLRIAFCDFWPEIKNEDIFTPILKEKYNVIIDNKNPDVVFHSVFNKMKDVSKYKCKKILFLGENYRAKNFNTDLSISFDKHSKTNFRLPLWQYFVLLKPSYIDLLLKRVKNKSFDRFCSFTVSNGNNPIRNSAFYLLSKYKFVHSYGRFMTNNNELIEISKNKYWRNAKDEFFNKVTHKFALTYENERYPYYTTEKIMDGFLGGSLPIYLGDPKIEEDFNAKAFINIANHTNPLDIIINIDNNKNLFNDIYNEPIFTNNQKNKFLDNLNEFKYWLLNHVK